MHSHHSLHQGKDAKMLGWDADKEIKYLEKLVKKEKDMIILLS